MSRLSLLILFMVWLRFGLSMQNENSWKTDAKFGAQFAACDFPVFDYYNQLLEEAPNMAYPFIVKNYVTTWKANVNWDKERLIEVFGQRVVRAGSESSIVYSGGVAENETTFAKILNDMSLEDVYTNGGSKYGGNSFIFDTTILKTIPELMADIEIPSIFKNWDNNASESRNGMWHMLSLGPSRTGLSFHNHGKTWLAVVHGQKQWFVYPLGYQPPAAIDKHFDPSNPVKKWVDDIWPQLQGLPKPPQLTAADLMILSDAEVREWALEQLWNAQELRNGTPDDSNLGWRPLECLQEPGDLLFLPSMWSHLTINVGETIAIGGQEALYDDERYNTAHEVLEATQGNFDAWKDFALAQFNRASHMLREVRNQAQRYISPSSNTQPAATSYLVHLQSGKNYHPVYTLDSLTAKTMDTWAVMYYDSRTDADTLVPSAHGESIVPQLHMNGYNTSTLLNTWQQIATLAHAYLNVAAVDLSNICNTSSLSTDNPFKTTESVCEIDAAHHYSGLPLIKVHRGYAERYLCRNVPVEGSYGTAEAEHQCENFTPDYEGVDLTTEAVAPSVMSPAVRRWQLALNGSQVLAQLKELQLQDGLMQGSIFTIPVSVQQRFADALEVFERAHEIKPMQMELITFMANCAGLARNLPAVETHLKTGEGILDRADPALVPPITQASLYHKLAHSYMQTGMHTAARALYAKSIAALPTFLPALQDNVRAAVMQGDHNSAEYALEQLRAGLSSSGKLTSPDSKDARELAEFEHTVTALPW